MTSSFERTVIDWSLLFWFSLVSVQPQSLIDTTPIQCFRRRWPETHHRP